MRIKLFFLLDLITTAIFSTYLFFLRGDEIAFSVGLTILIAFSPICLALTSPLVMILSKRAVKFEQSKINNSSALLTLSEADLVAMPLNRFLTDGDYFVTDLIPEGLSQSALLSFAATAEQNSSHELGKIIYKTALGRGLKIQNISAFHEIHGRGVEALVNNTTLRIGNPDWVKAQGVSVSSSLLTKIDQLAVHGKTPLLLSLGNMARGIVAMKDAVKPESKEFVSMLKRKKLETMLLTASSRKTARNFAKNFSLDGIKAGLSPEDKAREVQIQRAKGRTVAVIANEFHDLPALVNADISFLVNEGETTFLNENDEIKLDFEIPSPEKFLLIREIAMKAAELIKQNRRIAYLSWILLVPPALLQILENPPIFFPPIAAGAGVLIFSAIILANSLRAGRKKAEQD